MNRWKSPFKGDTWVLIGLLVLLASGATLSVKHYLRAPTPASERSPQATIPAKPVRPPVDLSALMERMQGGSLSLTPEQIREEQRIDDKQVEKAGKWLESSDPGERLAGAEQLAAYPTPESERLLVKTLESDLDPEVRRTAAMSLGYFQKPRKKTIQVLLAAVENPAAEVRSAALETLEQYLADETEEGSTRANQIVAALKALCDSRHTAQDIREHIRDLFGNRMTN